MKVKVDMKQQTTDNGAKGLLAHAAAVKAALSGSGRVEVGILNDSPKRTRDKGGSEMRLVEIAALHEFGAPAAGIPQRSFIRATVDEKKAEILKLQQVLASKLLKAEITVEQAFGLMGSKIVAMMQKRISQGIPPPNAESTREAKGSSKPLIDTGQLRSALTWVFKKGGE